MVSSEVSCTGIARLPLFILERARELGLARQELMQAAGLSEAELQNPDARVDLPKIRDLWCSMVECAGDPALGLRVGAATTVRGLGVVGYAMYYSRTLRDAFRRLMRYGHIIFDGLSYVLEEEPDTGLLVIDHTPLHEPRHALDAKIAAAVASAREITGAEIEPAEVAFPYERPQDASEQRRFFRGKLTFDQPRALIVFRASDLDRPVRTADETLCRYLERLAEEDLQSLSGCGSFSVRVRRAILSAMTDGRPTAKRVARTLGVSPRTLQRRLQAEATSYASILDAFRHDAAVRMLSNGDLPVYEVASRLGYSEPSSFHRAFRRWRNASPDGFRRKRRASVPPARQADERLDPTGKRSVTFRPGRLSSSATAPP